MKTKLIRGKAGLFTTVVAAFLFLFAACSTQPSDAAPTKDETAAQGDESVLTLHLTFLDPEGTLLTGNAVDVAIDDTACNLLTAAADGTVTVEDIHRGDSVDVTVYAENGGFLAISRIYVYTGEVGMYTENTDGVLYLYVEEGDTEVKAQMRIGAEEIFNCVTMISQ